MSSKLELVLSCGACRIAVHEIIVEVPLTSHRIEISSFTFTHTIKQRRIRKNHMVENILTLSSGFGMDLAERTWNQRVDYGSATFPTSQ